MVDDDGNLLTYGQPDEDNLPHIRHRQMNYMHVENSKYGKNAFERQLDTAEMRDEGVEEGLDAAEGRALLLHVLGTGQGGGGVKGLGGVKRLGRVGGFG